MISVDEIERAIAELPKEEFFRLHGKIQQRFEDEWDRQFERDVTSGKLDRMARAALAEHRAGCSSRFPADAK